MRISFKKFAVTLIIVISLGFLLSVVLAFDIRKKEALYFCLAPGCLSYALEIFAPSISILKSTLQFAGGLAVCWGVVISSMTYRDNATRLREADIQHHYATFREILRGHPLHQMVRDPVEAEKAIYNAIFAADEPRIGMLKSEFKETISEIYEYVRLNHPRIGEDNRRTTETSYNNSLNRHFNAIGIFFRSSRNSDIEPNSSAVFEFVDRACSDYPEVPKLSQFTTD